MVYNFLSCKPPEAEFSAKDDSNIVAKYSDLRFKISECAYMIRFRARACEDEERTEAADERRLGGISVFGDSVVISTSTSGSFRSRQTNRTSPVSDKDRSS